MELSRLGRLESKCLYLQAMELCRASSISLRFRKQMAMVVMGDLDRAAMAILLAGLMAGTVRAAKGRMEILRTMEDRKVALDQEAMEARTEILDQEAMEARMETPIQEAIGGRKKVQAPTMDLASRTQALSHKSTCTQRS